MIRLFEEKDANEVCYLTIRCYKEINSKVYPLEVIDFMVSKTTPERLISRAKKTTCFVYELENKILGTVSFDKNYIFSMYINPDYQGKNIGKELMKFAEDLIFKNYSNITLNASINSVIFYELLNYIKKEEIYQEGYGKSILMEKKTGEQY